jgi:hypothetical protein
MHYWTLMGWRI